MKRLTTTMGLMAILAGCATSGPVTMSGEGGREARSVRAVKAAQTKPGCPDCGGNGPKHARAGE